LPEGTVHLLEPPTEGYELEAWNSWCASKKVPATGSWARVKKEEALDDKLRSWEVFASDVETRFADPIRMQKALNEIHNFTQGCLQVAQYLDQFEILKTISSVGNDEALYLVK
jgi:hypothetical protein